MGQGRGLGKEEDNRAGEGVVEGARVEDGHRARRGG